MRKIPTLYIRDQTTHKVIDQVNHGCEWALDALLQVGGQEVPTRVNGLAAVYLSPAVVTVTRKYDGTATLFDARGWFARRTVKKDSPRPEYFELAELDTNTGIQHGWEPIEDSPFYTQWQDANELLRVGDDVVEYGTYELIGPKINNNPENVPTHVLVPHDKAQTFDVEDSELNYEGLKQLTMDLWTQDHIEGLVWHHQDGRMCKLKAKDFIPAKSSTYRKAK